MSHDIEAIQEKIREQSAFVERLVDEVGRVIVGQRTMVERLLIGLLADGHVLMEGVPGLAKTLTVRTLARAIDTGFQRIQFTPDLLPARPHRNADLRPQAERVPDQEGSDLLQYHPRRRDQPLSGQGAGCAARGDAGARTVTIGHETRSRSKIPSSCSPPRIPIEQEGTYPLPEAQVDRFMLKLAVGLSRQG